MPPYSVYYTDAGGVMRVLSQETESEHFITLHGALGETERLFREGAQDVTIYHEKD